MAIAVSLAKSMCTMLLMMLCGFTLVRTGILKGEQSKVLSLLSMYTVVPCMIINAFQVTYDDTLMRDFGYMAVIAIVIHIVLIAVTKLMVKPFGLRPVERATIMYVNCTNLIAPLIQMTFGADMVFFAMPYTAVFTILMWSHGRLMICNEGKVSLKKIFLNVNILATVTGILMFILRIKLPGVIGEAVSRVGNTTGPLNMIVIGMLLGSTDLKKTFGSGRIYLLAGLRLVVIPVIILLVLRVTRLYTLLSSPKLIMIIMMAVSAATASTVTNIAQVYDRDPETAMAVSMVTLILCVVTMPVINLLCQLILQL